MVVTSVREAIVALHGVVDTVNVRMWTGKMTDVGMGETDEGERTIEGGIIMSREGGRRIISVGMKEGRAKMSE